MGKLKPTFLMRQALVVDDEKIIADDLAFLINQRSGWTAIAITNVDDTMKTIESEGINVCFLDIEMPGQNGLSVGRMIKEKHPDIEIVFVTAFHQYATNAFRLEAVDYLVKPVTRELLAEACSRVERQYIVRNSSNEDVKQCNKAPVLSGEATRVRFQSGGRIEYIDVSTILFAKAAGNYVEIITNSRKYCIRSKFSNVVNSLLQHGFVRVHRSYIVNLAHVKGAVVSAKNISRLYMENGAVLPVSENYRSLLTTIMPPKL